MPTRVLTQPLLRTCRWTPALLVVLVSVGGALALEPGPATTEKPEPAPTTPGASEPETGLAPGREVLLIWRDGQRMRATWVGRDGADYVVRFGGLETRIPMSEIDRIAPQRPARERYLDMRAVIDDADVDRLLALAEWCRSNRLYDDALRDIAHVLALEPTNPEALRLSRVVEQEQALRRAETESGASVRPTPARKRPVGVRPDQFPLLTAAQANLLKVWELDLNHPPRLRIERATVDAFLDRSGDDPAIPSTADGREAFHRRAPVEILAEMFRLRARDLYGAVQVVGLPESLDRFRRDVNAMWLVNFCASTRCHGGADAGPLLLYNRDPRAERPALTNFLILDRSTLADGRPLIDYDNPERSPLLQLTLPPNRSAFPHPRVTGWRPLFRTPDARRFQDAVAWIRSMRRPRSEIPIEYEPPTPPTPAPMAESPTPAEPQPR